MILVYMDFLGIFYIFFSFHKFTDQGTMWGCTCIGHSFFEEFLALYSIPVSTDISSVLLIYDITRSSVLHWLLSDFSSLVFDKNYLYVHTVYTSIKFKLKKNRAKILFISYLRIYFPNKDRVRNHQISK